MPSIEVFRTNRLVAERLRDEDFTELRRLYQDSKVMATLGGLRSHDETRLMLRKNLDHWDRYGYGLWMFRDQADGRFIGRAGLRNVEVGGNDEVEVAYALRAEEWGKGIATEMAEAVLNVAFGPLAMSEVVSFTLPTNRASRRVMEKVGFTFERDVVHADQPHVLYRITAAAKLFGESS